MSLQSHHFITFGGAPVTGRIPPQMIVEGGGTLTREQYGAVAHAYKLFCDARLVSIGDYLVRHRTLADGTRVTMTSLQGRDTVRVTPPPRVLQLVLADTFMGVPTDAEHPLVLGEGGTWLGGIEDLGPAGRWTMQAHPTEMPEKLKKAGSPNDFPGRTTWSNADLKLHDFPVVLAVDGAVDPERRHIWINGRKVDTGVCGVTAACLHAPDDEEPNKVVVRVVSTLEDDGETQRLATVDLVTTDGVGSFGLLALLTVRTFFIKDTYTAEDWRRGVVFFDDDGQWTLAGPVRFNKAGTQLATIIAIRDCSYEVSGDATISETVVGRVGVAMDATTWTIDTRVEQPAITHSEGTSTSTGSDIGSSSGSGSANEDRIYLVDVNFLDDALVHVKLRWQNSVESSSEASWSGSGGSEGTLSSSSTTSSTLTLTHSVHGELYTATAASSSAFTATGDINPEAVLDWTVEHTFPYADWSKVVYCADLGRDVFAFGTTAATAMSESAAGATATSGSATTDIAFQPHLFELWMAGERQVSDTSGSYVNDAASTGTTTTATGMPGGTETLWPYPAEATTTSITTTWQSSPDDPGLFIIAGTACAVHAKRHVAYLAARGPTDGSGLEAALFKDAEDEIALQPVPAYADGTRPTIAWPVFLGLVAYLP